MPETETPNAQASEIQGISNSEWISSRLMVDYGAPFTFDGRPYLKKIHDLDERKILLRCLAGGSRILLPDGDRIRLDELVERRMVGTEIVTWSERRKTWGTTRITAIHLNGRRVVGKLLLADGKTLFMTGDHKVYTQLGVWKPVIRVARWKSDDPKGRRILIEPGGERQWMEVVSWEEEGEYEVFDLSVSNDHAYVANGILVHNCGRQVEKTSTLAAKLVSRSCLKNNWKCLYISPSQGQTRVFSHARLDRILASPYVKSKFFDSERCVDYVYEKQLLNGSSILLSYASTDADRVRGISTDMLFMDEIQDMTTDVFPVAEETLSHADDPWKVYAGTPKTLNNCMEWHWKNSTQCEWMVWCPCGAWVFQDEKIVKKAGPTCPSCGKILDPQFGRWEPYGKKDAEFMGFRIPQTMVPWIVGKPAKWSELVRKYEQWPQQQFYNEVLGLAHERGANPIAEEDLKKCCVAGKRWYDMRPADLYFDTLYCGVDWGAGLGSYTIQAIVGFHGGKIHVLYMKRFAEEKFEYEAQVEEIATKAKIFGCGLVGCDWGGGYAQNRMLALTMTGHADVIQMYESGTKGRDLSYNRESRLYTMNRQMAISYVIQLIKEQNLVLPDWEVFQEFSQDFTAVFSEYNTSLRCEVFDHPHDMPDDALHALMYAIFAWKIARGDRAI